MKKINLFFVCLALVSLACLETSSATPTAGKGSAAGARTLTKVLESATLRSVETPTADPLVKICASVTAAKFLNMRDMPDEWGSVTRRLPSTAEVVLIERTTPTWWLVFYDGKAGYVNSNFLMIAECLQVEQNGEGRR